MWPTSVDMPVLVTSERAGAAGDLGVHEREVDAIAEGRVRRDGLDLLGDRDALAGQRRLVDLEGRCREQPAVGRDEVAGLDVHDVARDQLLHRELDEPAVAPGLGLDDQHLLEGGDARRCLALLVEAHRGVEQGQADQHDARRDLVGEEQAQDAGRQQDDLHRVLVLAEEGLPARLLGGLGELVRPERGAPGLRLGGRQAGLDGHALAIEDVLRGEGVPGRALACTGSRGRISGHRCSSSQ